MNFLESLSCKFTKISVCTSFNRLLDLKQTKSEAISSILNNYKRHAPFNQLTDDDIRLASITIGMFNTNRACTFLGEIISDCGWKKNIAKLKDKNLFMLIFSSEVCSKIEQILKRNENLAKNKSLNLKETCKHIILNREGWAFVDEQELTLVCKYKEKEVLMYFSNQKKNIKDVLREIIYQEIAFENDDVLKKINNFDNFFNFYLNLVMENHK